mmetsp:Transcript_29500/g.53025  ORF Transcript_29500/g.53025 Transcript_29500/m.53025 type:complete len:84 (-) Transcript_29500:332-583(-)
MEYQGMDGYGQTRLGPEPKQRRTPKRRDGTGKWTAVVTASLSQAGKLSHSTNATVTAMPVCKVDAHGLAQRSVHCSMPQHCGQ